MVIHPIVRVGIRPAVATLAAVVLAAFAGSACRQAPPDAPVRTTTMFGSTTAPSAAQARDRDRALLRVVAVVPGASRLDLFLENAKFGDALEYRTVTPFIEIPSGRQALRLRPAGLDTAEPLAQETGLFRAGRHYTAVVMPGGDNGATAISVFEDRMDVPDAGRASVRVIHAGEDAGRIDVHVDGRQDALATALDFHNASQFTALEPPAVIELRPAGRTESMLRAPDLRLSDGGMYTLVVIGRTRTEPPLEVLVIEDRMAPS
jgi:hypothetical protein